MNYVEPVRNAFIIPQGTRLERKSESERLKKERQAIRDCMDEIKSSQTTFVFNVEELGNE